MSLMRIGLTIASERQEAKLEFLKEISRISNYKISENTEKGTT